MAAGRFCGPLAGEFAAFAATSEASATADKTTLAWVRHNSVGLEAGHRV